MVKDQDIETLGNLVISGHLSRPTADRILEALEDQFEGNRDLRTTFDDYIEEFQKQRTALEPNAETVQLETVSPDDPDSGPPVDSRPVDGGGNIDEFHPGAKLPGSERYSLEDKLGEGGAGVVWLARDQVLQRTVALKVLTTRVDDDGGQAQRFLFEAQTTGRLDHPGVIPVYDVGKLPDGRWFYTMQLIEDRDFEDVLQQRETDGEETQPLARLLKHFSRVCLTVAYAHDSGIIHRDIKPANILLGAYGEVYVVDWGLAKLYDEDIAPDAPVPGDDSDDELAGTPYYMSPEQIRGENAQLGPGTDVYSLGVILYRILTGEFPFDADSVTALLLRVETEDPPDPRDVAPDREIPDPLAEATLEALSHEADDRMSAKDFGDRVTEYLEGVKERKRRAERADQLLDRARALHQAYLQTRETVENQRSDLDERLAALGPSDGLEVRKPLWEQQHQIDERAHEAEELYSKCVQATRESLELYETKPARRLLADLYWYKYEEAREERDEAKAVYFRSLVEEYDDGRYADRLADEAALLIRLPPEAEATLYRETPVGPIFELEEVDIEWADMPTSVPTGTYRVRAETPDGRRAELPIQVDGPDLTEVDVQIPSPPETAEFCFVPRGRYTVGGDEFAPKSLPETTLEVEPFLMRKYPVTLEEYCEFLNDLAQSDLEKAKARSPRTTDGSMYYLEIDEQARTFSVPKVDDAGHEWEPDWPVVMINWYDAKAFVDWVSDRDTVDYQLPTEIQWEVAARGVDGRIFPWGNGFDPALCYMVESFRGRPIPTSVGSYPYDRSPFGIRDMAGLVLEWTRTPSGSGDDQYIQRGGSFNSPSNWCRTAARKNNQADLPYIPFGFRYVLEL